MNRLVIGPNWIGDAVMSLPLLRAIHRAHPGEPLSVIAPAGPAAIYRADESVDVLVGTGRLTGDALLVRRGRFDEAWLLPNSHRAALVAWLGRSRRRIGYATDGRAWLLTDTLAPPSGGFHQIRDYDALLRLRGIEPDLEPPRLVVSEEAIRTAGEALAAAALPADARPVLLAPGSARDAIKRWPAQRYAGLADALAERGLTPALVIGPGEQELAGRVMRAARTPLPALGADLDPLGLAALLAHARLLVSNDSGPMHLAAAVGTPVVAFFGPTDPGRTAGIGSPVRALDRYVFCSPCHLQVCPYGHECMREISVADALRAVEEMIGAERPSS
jgi:heptosyltransferase-2